MQAYVLWFIAAGVLLGIELATGTLYVLMLCVAAAVAALVAMTNVGLPVQLAVAAIVAVAGTMGVAGWRRRQPVTRNLASHPDVGMSVRVESRNPDGTLRVAYRGTQWDARLRGAHDHADQPLYIVQVDGTLLVLSNHKPS